MPKIKINTRSCNRCDETYFRRNLFEAWTSRGTGHRRGWHKEIMKVCIKCMDVREARQIINIVSLNPALQPSRKREKVTA